MDQSQTPDKQGGATTLAQPWKSWFVPQTPMSADFDKQPVILSCAAGQGSLPQPPRPIDFAMPKPHPVASQTETPGP